MVVRGRGSEAEWITIWSTCTTYTFNIHTLHLSTPQILQNVIQLQVLQVYREKLCVFVEAAYIDSDSNYILALVFPKNKQLDTCFWWIPQGRPNSVHTSWQIIKNENISCKSIGVFKYQSYYIPEREKNAVRIYGIL